MGDYVDLTMVLDTDTPTHPDDPSATIEPVATVAEDGHRVSRLTMASHFGTHLDAPSHFMTDGRTLDEYPPERFMGPARIIDVRGEDEINPDLSNIESGEMVFFWTGHADTESDGYFEDYPVVTESTARALVELDVPIVGLDSPSPDKEPYPVHEILLGNDVLLADNLVNPEEVGAGRIHCSVLPLKLRDADGAPCRIIAEVQKT